MLYDRYRFKVQKNSSLLYITSIFYLSRTLNKIMRHSECVKAYKKSYGGVITLDKVGDMVQTFTDNENPNNVRAILLDNDGLIYFMTRGFG